MTPEELLQQEVEEWRKSLKRLNAKITELEKQIANDDRRGADDSWTSFHERVPSTQGIEEAS